MRNLARAAAVGGLVAASLVAVGAAAGNPPSIEKGRNVPASFVDDETCPFPVQIDGVDNYTIKTFFDKDGNPVSDRVHDNFVATDTGPTGKTVQERDAFNYTFDYATGVETYTGLAERFFSSEGGGILVRDAGRISFDADGNVLVNHGPHPLAVGDVEAYCAALAP